jgi:hypothetical protein
VFQTNDGTNTYGGIPVTVSGMNSRRRRPLRRRQDHLRRRGTVDSATNEVNGMPTSASLDWTVIDCHIRGGNRCTPQHIAQLDAQKAQGTLSGGMYRSHVQPHYYTCPLYNADVPDSLTTFDPLDGGQNLDLGTPSRSFSLIEQDIERMGCATCHDRFTGPGQLHLVYWPWTPEIMRMNWQKLLP